MESFQSFEEEKFFSTSHRKELNGSNMNQNDNN